MHKSGEPNRESVETRTLLDLEMPGLMPAGNSASV
jgi:hypothetical protein